jgi:ABC-2 type transport system ATP-binding protein
MMIEVSKLTKRYAGNTAVADLSFAVARGEIIRLPGPNGAGKRATMHMLSCFTPAMLEDIYIRLTRPESEEEKF